MFKPIVNIIKPVSMVLLVVVVLTGCGSLAYYGHVAKGQWQLLQTRQPIDKLIAAPDTDPQLRQRLHLIQSIRTFASSELLLADNNSYRDYVALPRRYVVWNVFAAEEFAITPVQWCFPVAGCVSYRGYFNEKKAQHFADSLRAQGYESYVAGVSAYSTLGWFDDPVLSTFLYRDDSQLAGLIFHELSHQLLYVAGDTTFNESFASAVEQEGLRRWLAFQQQPASLLAGYYQRQQMQQDFINTVMALREQLDEFYRQTASQPSSNNDVRRRQKQQLLAEFQSGSYQAFKARWQTDRYDHWVESGINNAKLTTVASYHQWLPSFQQLLAESNSLSVFYQRAKKISTLAPEQRQLALQSLLNKHQQLNLQTQ